MKEKLRDIICKYGPNVVEEKEELESIINTLLLDESKRELNTLKMALREGVVKELNDGGESRAGICASKLTDEYAIEKDISNWAVETWFFALTGKEIILSIPSKVRNSKSAESRIEKPLNPAFVEKDDMVFVKGGYFLMGSNELEDEKPIHKVWVDDFYICKYEVRQKKWMKLMGNNPSYFKGDDLPVECVNWNDVQIYIRKLNKKTGRKYRLPTEAEWEYAARGGNMSKSYKFSGGNNLDEVAWYFSNSENKTHPVGTKEPNELGLYDMSGNVWDWCSDWYDNDYYKYSPERNPKGAIGGSKRSLRGGSWDYSDYSCGSSVRGYSNPDVRYSVIGFRIIEDL